MLNINFTPFPVLTTPRLLLRQMTMADLPEMFFLRSDEETVKYISRPRAKTYEDAARYITLFTDAAANNEGITWAIAFNDKPETIIGHIGFWRIIKEHHRAEIGYLLNPQHQGKGIMQQALTAALDYAFNTMHLHTIEGGVNPANAASIKLLERNGFVREAYFREDFFWEGEYHDSTVYSLIAPKK